MRDVKTILRIFGERSPQEPRIGGIVFNQKQANWFRKHKHLAFEERGRYLTPVPGSVTTVNQKPSIERTISMKHSKLTGLGM